MGKMKKTLKQIEATDKSVSMFNQKTIWRRVLSIETALSLCAILNIGTYKASFLTYGIYLVNIVSKLYIPLG